jgi:hypothetical protein
MPDSFYERFRLTRPELNRPEIKGKHSQEIKLARGLTVAMA